MQHANMQAWLRPGEATAAQNQSMLSQQAPGPPMQPWQMQGKGDWGKGWQPEGKGGWHPQGKGGWQPMGKGKW